MRTLLSMIGNSCNSSLSELSSPQSTSHFLTAAFYFDTRLGSRLRQGNVSAIIDLHLLYPTPWSTYRQGGGRGQSLRPIKGHLAADPGAERGVLNQSPFSFRTFRQDGRNAPSPPPLRHPGREGSSGKRKSIKRSVITSASVWKSVFQYLMCGHAWSPVSVEGPPSEFGPGGRWHPRGHAVFCCRRLTFGVAGFMKDL